MCQISIQTISISVYQQKVIWLLYKTDKIKLYKVLLLQAFTCFANFATLLYLNNLIFFHYLFVAV